MKRIKQTLAAGFLACAALNQVKAEVSPLSYGVKGFGSISGLMGVEDALKVGGKAGKAKLFDLGTVWGSAGIYGEYAFSNYLGVALDLCYLRTGGSLVEKVATPAEAGKPEENSTAATASIALHSIVVPISLCVYPMGRGDDESLLKVLVGATISYPFMKTVKLGADKLDKLEDKQKKELSTQHSRHLTACCAVTRA